MSLKHGLRISRLWAFLLISALAAPAYAEEPREKLVLITRIGWHSGIVIARRDLPEGAIPEAADFPDAAYLEFGFGHAKYYPLRHKTIDMMLDGVFPAEAVIHLIGLPRSPRDLFPDHQFAALRLAPADFRRLVDFLDASFARAGAARAKPSAPGHYEFSRFYPAIGRFHLFNTCNTWTARALVAAGLPIRPAGIQHADALMAQLGKLGVANLLPGPQ